MGKIVNICLCIFLLMGMLIPAKANKLVNLNSIKSDSSQIKPRSFDQSVLKQYRAQKEFQYSADYQSPQSVWSRFWKWFWNFLENRITNAASNSAIQYITILILAGLVIWIAIKFSGVGVLLLFTGKAKSIPLAYDESLENIHDIDFDPEIEKAIKRNDYRLAVRMLYLKCLKKLSDSGAISWQIDKTNSNYIADLENSMLKEKFSYLTNRFEFIWYGEFNIDQSAFLEIHTDFKDFNKGL